MYKKLPKFNDISYAHFVTTRTYRNRPYFENEEFSCILLDELQFYANKLEFVLIGYVIMPDHLHLLLWWDTEEKPELSVSKIMQCIKGSAARLIINLVKVRGLERMLQSTPRDVDYGLRRQSAQSTRVKTDPRSHKRNLKNHMWQPGFYDFNIYKEKKLSEKLDYIHKNPVRAGSVDSPSDFRWSSYRGCFEEERQVSSQIFREEACLR